MNTVVTSKEIILEASKKLIREEGLNSINIRSVACACGVSVGSIYNMLLVLQKDALVKPDAFDVSFSPEKFVDFIFSHLIAALVRGDFDSSTLVEMIRRSIYLS